MWLLILLWSGICLVWAFLLRAQVRARGAGLLLEPAGDDPPAAPSVCVIVPVRNAQGSIEPCLRTVLAQTYPGLSLIVVDDRSDDDTAAVVEDLLKGDARASLLRIDELPPNWLGKSHALWTAVAAADAEWLLFLDDDCTLEPAAVRTAMLAGLEREADMVTLWPRHAGRSFSEHLLIPLCGGVIAMWYGSPEMDGGRGRAFANGQFIMIRRDAYERIGGHRAVRTALIEDVALAERARLTGLRTFVGSGARLFSVRMYESYRGLRDGWARIFVGALRGRGAIFLSLAWLLFGSLTPYVAGPLIAAAIVRRGGAPPSAALIAAAAVCAAHLVLMMVVSYRFWGMGGCRRRYLWIYPLSVLGVAGILLRAWWWLDVRRRVSWRDTRYAIDRNARIIGS